MTNSATPKTSNLSRRANAAALGIALAVLGGPSRGVPSGLVLVQLGGAIDAAEFELALGFLESRGWISRFGNVIAPGPRSADLAGCA